MTNSNGQFNPHPLANPFNTRIGPANYTLNPCAGQRKFSIKMDSNAAISDTYGTQTFDVRANAEIPQNTAAPQMSLRDLQLLATEYARNTQWNDSEIYSYPGQLDKRQIYDETYWTNVEKQARAEKIPNERLKLQQELMREFENGDLVKFSQLEDE